MGSYHIDFGSILTRTLETVIAASLVGILGALGGYLLKGLPFINSDLVSIGSIVLWCQVVIIAALTLLMIFFVPLRLPAFADPKYEGARDAASQFISYWQMVWVSFLFFYTISALTWNATMATPKQPTPDWIEFLESLFYVASTSFLLLCYAILKIRSAKAADRTEWNRVRLMIFLISCVIVAVSIVNSNVSPIANFLNAKVGGSLGGILIAAMKLVPDLFCGVVLALFVGRLESRFMGTPEWVIVALYCYALLQIAYGPPDFKDSDATFRFLMVITLALMLKILLFREVNRLIRSGNLTEYMFRYRQLLDERT